MRGESENRHSSTGRWVGVGGEKGRRRAEGGVGVSALCCVFLSLEREHVLSQAHPTTKQLSHTRLTHVWALTVCLVQ